MVLEYISPAIGIALIAVLLSLFDAEIIQTAVDISALMYPETAFTLDLASGYLALIIFVLQGLAVLGFFLGFLVAWLVYYFYTFTMEEFDLRLKRGVLHREEISIPYRQMQNVNIVRSLFYQIIGVSKLYIDSAGHEEPGAPDESEIILKPIEKEVAEQIRSLLEHRIGVQMVENTSALGHN
jgi:putative membrane protein